MGQAPFDASALDNLRRLAEHSAAPGHIYPLALLCHNIMPPPRQVCFSDLVFLVILLFSCELWVVTMLFQVEKEIGEKRMISFHGTGLSVAPEMSFSDITASCDSPEEVSSIHLPGWCALFLLLCFVYFTFCCKENSSPFIWG